MANPTSTSELNRERVFRACNELYASGTKPTVRLVQSMVDEISSLSTIHSYFSEWKKERDAREKTLVDKLGFSEEFIQAFSREINRFSIESEQRHKGRADEAQAQLESALSQMFDLEDKLDAQRDINHSQTKDIEALKNDLKSAQQQYDTRVNELTMAHESTVQELRRQLQEAKQDNVALTQANEGLRTDLSKAQLKLETQSGFVDDAKAQQQAVTAQLDTLRTNLAETQRALAASQAEAGANQKLITSVEQRLSSADALIAELRERAERAEKGNAQLEQALKEAQTVATSLREERAELKSTLGEQRQVIAKLTAPPSS